MQITRQSQPLLLRNAIICIHLISQGGFLRDEIAHRTGITRLEVFEILNSS